MSVAPFESCVSCLKGDTTTVLGLEGEGEFIMAALGKMGVDDDDAKRLVLDLAVTEYKCDPGKVPAGDMEMHVRVCVSCAHKAGMVPGKESAIPIYAQPEEWRKL